MKNPTAFKALHALSHPLSIGAIVLLLINDHVLRLFWPSWWTGKLGDFAWLYFMPFASAALIAWFIPSRWKRHEVLVGVLAYGLTGGVFALGKTSPSFHLWLVDQLEHLFGMPIGLRCDPTDLIALPALMASYWMWTRHVRFQPEPSQRGLILIPVAALLTIANMMPRPPDNKGIDCLMLRENAVYAYATYANSGENNAYVSTDGGYSWAAASIDEHDDCVPAGIRQIWDPSNPDLRFRFGNQPSVIEVSTDAGGTWQEEFQIKAIGEIEDIIIRNTHHGPLSLDIEPQDALIDPSSGNLLLAMGFRGLLMREANGHWVWIPVEIYRFIEQTPPEYVGDLMKSQIHLAVCFLLLGVATAAARTIKKRGPLVLLGFFWAIWLFLVFNSSPAEIIVPYYNGRYTLLRFIFWWIMYPMLGLSLLSMLHFSRITLRQLRNDSWRTLILSAIGAGLFLVPFFLWAEMLISNYGKAIILAIVLAFIPLLIGDQWHRLRRSSTLESDQTPEENTDLGA